MRHGSLFSGIGGFDLAAEWMGWENVFHCEINPFGRQVLEYYWPDAISYENIKETDFTTLRGAVDIISGGFPCQPFSTAGSREGTEDDRHLWPEMLRAIREIQPIWVVGENVRGLVNWSGGMVFEQVYIDLEAEGYEVTSFLLPAAAVNAPHRRDRIWFVAYNNLSAKESSGKGGKAKEIRSGTHLQQDKRISTTELGHGLHDVSRHHIDRGWQDFPTQPPVCGRDDGISSRLDGITFPKWRTESIKAYGNAVVPQLVYQIFKAIEAYEAAATI